jgi:acid phosphatase (class A)
MPPENSRRTGVGGGSDALPEVGTWSHRLASRLAVILTVLLIPAVAMSVFIALAAHADIKEQVYIDRSAFDITAVLPIAPQPGTVRYEADRALFRRTRIFAGTRRWTMAINDVRIDAGSLMQDFACATGLGFAPKVAPKLTQLLSRASADTKGETAIAKDYFKRLRPFLIDHGTICQPRADVEETYDYPSGHTTLGWTWAIILAELIPDRAAAILARGRAYGESRIVCGVHNASAVDAGRMSASATLAAVRTTSAYQVDFAAAREELASLRATVPAPPKSQCRAEAALVSLDIFNPHGAKTVTTPERK